MKNEILQAIQEEQRNHEQGTPQDVLKLVAQACFGPGHLIENEKAALQALIQEKKQVHAICDCQYIGNGYVRFPLSRMESQDLALWNHLFIKSANYAIPDPSLYELTAGQITGVSCNDIQMAQNGIHHSEIYHKLYDPHYRVIKKEYVDFFPVLRYVDQMIKNCESFCIAIDGRCASGKSTLAQVLMELYQCNIFHMDDYFLTPEQRTVERLRTPGGNVDYERFHKEILDRLERHQDVVYRVYDCKRQTLCPPCHKPYQPYTFIEGSYAHHPYFQQALQGRIFLTCDTQIQKKRLKQRSPYLYERFLKEWIPMEEAYFNTFQIQEHSDMILDTTEC